MEKKKRTGNITEEQRILLLEFMKGHPELVSGKFTKTFTHELGAKLWKEVTEILNACNGGEKDWKAWRRVIIPTVPIYNSLRTCKYVNFFIHSVTRIFALAVKETKLT